MLTEKTAVQVLLQKNRVCRLMFTEPRLAIVTHLCPCAITAVPQSGTKQALHVGHVTWTAGEGLCPFHFLHLARFCKGEGPFPGSFSGVMSHDCAFLGVSVDHNVFILINKREHGGVYMAVLTLVNSLLKNKKINCIVNLYFCFLFF